MPQAIGSFHGRAAELAVVLDHDRKAFCMRNLDLALNLLGRRPGSEHGVALPYGRSLGCAMPLRVQTVARFGSCRRVDLVA